MGSQSDSSSQSQPCAETGPNRPSSPEALSAGGGAGHRHTRILEAINAELMLQHPGAFHEEDDGELILPSGVTPQTAFVKIDTSAIAEAVLATEGATK